MTPCEDLREARLIVVPDINNVQKKYRAMAALMGRTILSGPVLDGHGGAKLVYTAGFKCAAFVFVSDAFKRAEPGLTLILRLACAKAANESRNGWQAKTLEEACKKTSQKKQLVLKGKHEAIPGNRPKQVLSLTGDEFVAWATKTYFLDTRSAWIKGA